MGACRVGGAPLGWGPAAWGALRWDGGLPRGGRSAGMGACRVGGAPLGWGPAAWGALRWDGGLPRGGRSAGMGACRVGGAPLGWGPAAWGALRWDGGLPRGGRSAGMGACRVGGAPLGWGPAAWGALRWDGGLRGCWQAACCWLRAAGGVAGRCVGLCVRPRPGGVSWPGCRGRLRPEQGRAEPAAVHGCGWLPGGLAALGGALDATAGPGCRGRLRTRSRGVLQGRAGLRASSRAPAAASGPLRTGRRPLFAGEAEG